MQLRDELGAIEAAGLQVVGISYDSVEVLKRFSDAAEIPFPLLSDEGSRTIKAFGIHYKEGLPYPGTIIVDSKGTIRAKIFREGYRDRHSVDELLSSAQSL